jgi:hypothetical protein
MREKKRAGTLIVCLISFGDLVVRVDGGPCAVEPNGQIVPLDADAILITWVWRPHILTAYPLYRRAAVVPVETDSEGFQT